MITNGENGFLVDPEDVEGMSKLAIDVLQAPERRAAVGKAARAAVCERFDIETAVRRYLDLYESLLAGAPPGGVTREESAAAHRPS